jgi:hypothetical protein
VAEAPAAHHPGSGLAEAVARRWQAAFGGVRRAEWWGYALWGVVGLIIAVPEIAAAAWHGGPWPTISGTIGHLEVIWSGTAILVVAVIVAVVMHMLRYRPDSPTMGVIRPVTGLRRTQSGRLTKRPMRTAAAMRAQRKDWIGYAYLATAFLAVLVPSVLVGTLVRGSSDHTKWIVGYVIYGCIAVFCVALPSALAYWVSDVPFPTLFRTISDLERLWRPIAVVIVAGLAVLLVHLALYPWPDIARILQHAPTTPTSP